MNCKKCGKISEELKRFCGYCGAKLEDEQEQEREVQTTRPSSKEMKSSSKTVIVIALAILLIIVISLLANVLLREDSVDVLRGQLEELNPRFYHDLRDWLESDFSKYEDVEIVVISLTDRGGFVQEGILDNEVAFRSWTFCLGDEGEDGSDIEEDVEEDESLDGEVGLEKEVLDVEEGVRLVIRVVYDSRRVPSEVERQLRELLGEHRDFEERFMGLPAEFKRDLSNIYNMMEFIEHLDGFFRQIHEYDWREELNIWANQTIKGTAHPGVSGWMGGMFEHHREEYFYRHESNEVLGSPHVLRFPVNATLVQDMDESNLYWRYRGISWNARFTDGLTLEEAFQWHVDFATTYIENYGYVPIKIDISKSEENEAYSAMIPTINPETGEVGMATVIVSPDIREDGRMVGVVVVVNELGRDISTTAILYAELVVMFNLLRSYEW